MLEASSRTNLQGVRAVIQQIQRSSRRARAGARMAQVSALARAQAPPATGRADKGHHPVRDAAAGEPPSVPRAKSAHQINDQADQQDETEAAAADGRAANIKAAAAKQEEEYNDQ